MAEVTINGSTLPDDRWRKGILENYQQKQGAWGERLLPQQEIQRLVPFDRVAFDAEIIYLLER